MKFHGVVQVNALCALAFVEIFIDDESMGIETIVVDLPPDDDGEELLLAA